MVLPNGFKPDKKLDELEKEKLDNLKIILKSLFIYKEKEEFFFSKKALTLLIKLNIIKNGKIILTDDKFGVSLKITKAETNAACFDLKQIPVDESIDPDQKNLILFILNYAFILGESSDTCTHCIKIHECFYTSLTRTPAKGMVSLYANVGLDFNPVIEDFFKDLI